MVGPRDQRADRRRAARAWSPRSPAPPTRTPRSPRSPGSLAAPGAAGCGTALELLPELRARLLGLLGVSDEIAAHLIAHPRHWEVLLDELDPDGVARRLAAAVGADPADPVTGTGGHARRA